MSKNGNGSCFNPPELNTEDFFIEAFVRTRRGKVIEGFVGYPNDFFRNEFCPFNGSVFRMFDRTFPFQYRLSIKVILGKLGENCVKIHLSIAQGTEPSSPFYPA